MALAQKRSNLDQSLLESYFSPSFKSLPIEVFRVLLLTSDGRPLKDLLIAIGSRTYVDAPLRRVFHEALNAGARRMVMAHNHPGGDPTPSLQDIAVTRSFAQIGHQLEVPLHDHLIFASGGVFSMRAAGLL
ncbi:hypothetical protein GVO57_14440 (plasmid) [Sphingomonas changnyeongensis]|uniref:MPN domain-containing protein n=1 Tax=Sphingomonas changnyeongensis TaxID=2698679 RepID=A0A7Z2NYD2_9SPHN|nr:hypothetical protein GVO57_14440 [Sphingomonas changnyeongensis]